MVPTPRVKYASFRPRHISVALDCEIVERALENKCFSVCWCRIHEQFLRLLVCRTLDAQVDTGHACDTRAPFQTPHKSHARTREEHNTDNKPVDVSATATHPGDGPQSRSSMPPSPKVATPSGSHSISACIFIAAATYAVTPSSSSGVFAGANSKLGLLAAGWGSV